MSIRCKGIDNFLFYRKRYLIFLIGGDKYTISVVGSGYYFYRVSLPYMLKLTHGVAFDKYF